MNVKRQLTPEQFADLEASDLVADEAHRRWQEALKAAEQAEMDLVAAIAAYDLKRVQYRVK